jgi:hypothetical protein
LCLSLPAQLSTPQVLLPLMSLLLHTSAALLVWLIGGVEGVMVLCWLGLPGMLVARGSDWPTAWFVVAATGAASQPASREGGALGMHFTVGLAAGLLAHPPVGAAVYPLLLMMLVLPGCLLMMPIGCRNCGFLALLTPSLLPHHRKLQLLAALVPGGLMRGLALAVVLVAPLALQLVVVAAVKGDASTAAVSAASVVPMSVLQEGVLGALQVLPLAASLGLLLVAAALTMVQAAAGEVWPLLLPSVACSWVHVSGQAVALVVVVPSVGALQGEKQTGCALVGMEAVNGSADKCQRC